MDFLTDLIRKPYPSQQAPEVEKLISELVQIGIRDDFLSLTPGGGFDLDKRNVRTRQIGTRLLDIGGMALMEYAQRQVKRKSGKLGRSLAEHLEYAWAGIGRWMK